jgi:hypothetical protein
MCVERQIRDCDVGDGRDCFGVADLILVERRKSRTEVRLLLLVELLLLRERSLLRG